MKKLNIESSIGANHTQFLTKMLKAGNNRPKLPEGTILRVVSIDYLDFTHEGERVQIDGRWRTCQTLDDWTLSGRLPEYWAFQALGMRVAVSHNGGRDFSEVAQWALQVSEVLNAHSNARDILGQPWQPAANIARLYAKGRELDQASPEFVKYLKETFTESDLRVYYSVGIKKADPATGIIQSGWKLTGKDKTWTSDAIQAFDLVAKKGLREAPQCPLLDLYAYYLRLEELEAKSSLSEDENAEIARLRLLLEGVERD